MLLQMMLLVDMLAIGLMVPVLYRCALANGGTTEEYGMLLGALGFAQVVGAPAMAWVGGRYGQKNALLVAYAGAAFSYLSSVYAPSFLWFAALRIPGGVLNKSKTITYGLAAHLTPPETRTTLFSRLKAIVAIAFTAGPLLGGVLADYYLKLPAMVSGGLFGVLFIVGWLFLPNVGGEVQEKKKGISLGFVVTVRRQIATMCCMEFAEKLYRAAIPVIMNDTFELGSVLAGAVWSGNAALGAGMGVFGLAALQRRVLGRTIALWCMVINAVSVVLWCAHPTTAFFVGTFAMYITSNFAAESCLVSEISTSVASHEVAPLLLHIDAINSVVSLLAPCLVGRMMAFSPYLVSCGGAVLYLAAAVVFVQGTKRRGNEVHEHRD